MRPPRARFTIRGLMIAVGLVAGLLALSRWPAWPLLVLCGFNLISASMLWRSVRGFRRLAAWGFGVVATVVNIACAIQNIYFQDLGGHVIGFLGWFITFPLIAALGAAWAASVSRPPAIHPRSPLVAWPLVPVLAVLPLTMSFTQWPFRLAFFASRSALNQLADQVANEQLPSFPRWAGVFRVLGSTTDSSTGNIGLITDLNPA